MDCKLSVKCLHVPERSGSLVMVSLKWPSWLSTLHSPSKASGRAPVLERLMRGADQNSMHPPAMASRGRQNSELPKFDPKYSSHPSSGFAWQDSFVKTVWGTPQSLSPSFERWRVPILMFSPKASGTAEGQSYYSMCPWLGHVPCKHMSWWRSALFCVWLTVYTKSSHMQALERTFSFIF